MNNDHFDYMLENNINASNGIGEVLADSIKAYNLFIKRYFEYCKEISQIMVKSIDIRNIPINKNTGVISTDFFNGFMSGYETAKQDIYTKKEVDKEPANFYL